MSSVAQPEQTAAQPLHQAAVFVSYSRRSTELCKQVCALIQRELNLAVFVDRDDIPGGQFWQDEIERQLQGDHRPDLLLIATQAAVDRPEIIVQELVYAFKSGLRIVPLEFEPHCALPLLRKAAAIAGMPPDGKLPQVVVMHALPVNTVQLENDLRRALLLPRLEQLLAVRIAEFTAWSTHLHHDNSFWDGLWQPYAPALSAQTGLALIGPAGSGKSALAARVIRGLMQATILGGTGTDDSRPIRFQPVLLREADLRDNGASLASELGASSIEHLANHLAQCRQSFGIQIVLVADGLDQMAPDEGKTFLNYADAFARLQNAMPTIATCRREVWSEVYRQRVSLAQHDVEQVPPGLVAAEVGRVFPGRQVWRSPLLGRALFLDLLLRHGSGWADVPADDIGFLHRLWRTLSVSQRRPSAGGELSCGDALAAIGKLQLAGARFDVSWSGLRAAAGDVIEAAVGELLQLRLLRVVGHDRLRFSHDLLDAYNMAERMLAPNPDLDALVDRLGDNGMWSVAATVGALARAQSRADLSAALFQRFLQVLDRKRWDTLAMDRAWAVTFALQERFTDFLPAILACFDTNEITASLVKGVPGPGSACEPPRLTQEAGSTLASAFQALRVGKVEDAPVVLPRLVGKLETWGFRFRLVEAIGKFAGPAARQALTGFVRCRLQDQKDAKALAVALNVLRDHDHPDVRQLLHDIQQMEAVTLVVRRAAVRSLDYLQSGGQATVRRDDDELIESLRTFDVDDSGRPKPGYSDWREVESAAREIESRIRMGGEQPAPAVVDALVSALDHDQTAVRCSVAQCLMLVDSPRVALALIDELGEAELPSQVRLACEGALRQVLNRTAGPRRLALRLVAMRAAVTARQAGLALSADALLAVARDTALVDHQPILDGAVSLTAATSRLPNLRVDQQRSLVGMHPKWALQVLSADEIEAAEPELERKFRYVGVESDGDGLALVVAPSSWPIARAFHVLALTSPERLGTASDLLDLLPAPLGGAQAPGIACVHAVVRTSDAMILMARRSLTARYAPGAWSISFEEQVSSVTADAIDGPECPITTACRGFVEEFGLEIPTSAGRVVGALLEVDTMNVAVVVRLDVPFTARQIHDAWFTPPRPSHHFEAAELAFVSDTSDVAASIADEGLVQTPLHPTARLRARMAHLGGPTTCP